MLLMTREPISAGVHRWTTGGPAGGELRTVAVDPSAGHVVYVGTSVGLEKSVDGGATFVPSNAGLFLQGTNDVPGVSMLAVDPWRPARVFASGGSELFRSEDGGASWCSTSTPGQGPTGSIVFDPATSDTAYGLGPGAFKTSDGGETWSQIRSGNANAFAVDPLVPSTLLLAENNLYRSTDGGTTWSPPLQIVPGGSISAVVFDPSASGTAYASTGSALFKSFDHGATWTALPVTWGASSLLVDPSSPAAVYALRNRSIETRYQQVVYRSTDGGTTWANISAGLLTGEAATAYIFRLALGTGSPARLLAATTAGLYETADRGERWSYAGGATGGTDVTALVASPKRPLLLDAVASGHVARSVDGGVTWTATGSPSGVEGLAVDPENPSTLYVTASRSLQKSIDGGRTWQPAMAGLNAEPMLEALAVAPSDPSTLYVSNRGHGLFRSTTAGANWLRMGFTPNYVRSLAIDPTNPGTVYVSCYPPPYGVFRSTDGGGHWQTPETAMPQGFVIAVAVDPVTPSTIYALFQDPYNGLHRSLDRGATWSQVGRGPGGSSATALALDPAHPSRLYVATERDGIFRSTDGGRSWTAMRTGFPGRIVSSLVVDSSGSRVHAGMRVGGVFDWEFDPSADFGQLVPVVLDVSNGSAHYTTELTLTNAGSGRVPLSLSYTAALGSREGSGTVADELAPGEQRRIPDVLPYLRTKGLAIPTAATQPSQGGSLLLRYAGPAADPSRVGALARTAAVMAPPQPAGSAGLAYGGPLVDEESASLTVYGLRSTSTDRSNLAVVNTSDVPVTFRVTLFSGTGDRRSVSFRSAESLPPRGWIQYNSTELLDGTGIANGWAVVERTCSAGALTAYGVVNDRQTNDGSFLFPVTGSHSCCRVTVPVLVETARFRSELVLTNTSDYEARFELGYVESLSPARGAGGTTTIHLQGRTQLVMPEAIDFLRRQGIAIGPPGEASYAGSLRVTSTDPQTPVGARTAALSPVPGGGQFGLFTPGIYRDQEAQASARILGLAANATSRSNVAVVNTGDAADGPVTLNLRVHDGDASGASRGAPFIVTLSSGQWRQFDDILRSVGVANGWVEITRVAGTAPWIAYGVINDGASPGERTGDGAYVPMTR